MNDDEEVGMVDGETSLAEAWRVFSKRALPAGCHDAQREDMRYAFWAGAATSFARVAAIMGCDANDDDRGAMLEAFSEEIISMAKVAARAHARAEAEPNVQGGRSESRMMKIDPLTGEETLASPEEALAVLAKMREALLHEEGNIEFSEEAKAQLRAKGMSEDEIKAMLAEFSGAKQ